MVGDDKDNSKKSKFWAGLLSGMFLGLIGLLLGLCTFDKGSQERESFVEGWCCAFFIAISICLFLLICVLKAL